MIIFKAMVEQMKLYKEKERLDGQIKVLKRCGLEQEAKKLLDTYNAIVMRIKALDEDVKQQRLKSAFALISCFIAGDIATLTAEKFGDVCKEVNAGMTDADNDFVKLIKKTADAAADNWNKVVQIFDEGAKDFNFSMFYASFSERITDKILPLIEQEVENEITNTELGKKYFKL